MDIDIEKFKTDGPNYVDSLIQKLLSDRWDELKEAKFKDSTKNELTIMKNLWSHGFLKGAEAATVLSDALYTATRSTKL